MTTLRQQWLNNLAKEAQHLELVQATQGRIREDELLVANERNAERAEQKRMSRLIRGKEQEEARQEAMAQDIENRRIRDRQREQEGNLARELERSKMDATRDEKMRQQVREGSQELRELEAKLREAYVAKERIAQMAEKRALEYDRMNEDSEIMRAMKEEAERAERMEREWVLNRAGSKVRYQQELERQLEEQEGRKQEAYQEFLKEKLMIDEIVRKIYEEDQRSRELQLQKRHATQAYIHEFNEQREAWKLAEKARMEEENRRIREFMQAQIAKEAEAAKFKKEKEAAMSAAQEKLSEEIVRKQRERQEMEDIRQELVLEEQEERVRHAEREEFEKRIRQRLEMQADHSRQMQMRERALEAERVDEDKFRQAMLDKFAEDDRIEQLNAQKRRMKQLEHKRAVEELLVERRRQYERERATEKADQDEIRQREEFRRQIIEEERKKMLQEHAKKLLGYLPRGVILSAEDVAMLGPEFEERYRKQEIDPNDEEYWENYHRERERRK